MRSRSFLTVTWLAVAAAGAASARPLAAQDPETRRTFALPHVLEAVGKAVDQPMPDGLSPADQKAYADQTTWLKTVRDRIQSLGSRSGVLAPRDRPTGQASGQRRYPPAQAQQEIEALRKAIELESRRFNTLSNASKARHDIAMNAIRNMKA
jgi:hypothetical protein